MRQTYFQGSQMHKFTPKVQAQSTVIFNGPGVKPRELGLIPSPQGRPREMNLERRKSNKPSL